jgi:hypothetical protein
VTIWDLRKQAIDRSAHAETNLGDVLAEHTPADTDRNAGGAVPAAIAAACIGRAGHWQHHYQRPARIFAGRQASEFIGKSPAGGRAVTRHNPRAQRRRLLL